MAQPEEQDKIPAPPVRYAIYHSTLSTGCSPSVLRGGTCQEDASATLHFQDRTSEGSSLDVPLPGTSIPICRSSQVVEAGGDPVPADQFH